MYAWVGLTIQWLQVLEALSHGMLLSSDVPTQVGVSHITHCIKEVGGVIAISTEIR